MLDEAVLGIKTRDVSLIIMYYVLYISLLAAFLPATATWTLNCQSIPAVRWLYIRLKGACMIASI
jgi:hypothetical protein